MHHVWIQGNVSDAVAIAGCAKSLQDQFEFGELPGPESIPLRFVHVERGGLFTVDRKRGVQVNTWQSGGICNYCMLPRELYLLTVSMLGLIRYRGLQLNPLLQAEDFLHDHPSDCLCARRLFIEEYALVFEDPHVCRACWRFLRELCPATEVEAAERVVAQAALIVRGTAITRATPGGFTS